MSILGQQKQDLKKKTRLKPRGKNTTQEIAKPYSNLLQPRHYSLHKVKVAIRI